MACALVAAMQAAAGPVLAAVAECSYRVEGAGPDGPRRLRVGDVDRAGLGPGLRIVNDGPHDLRIGFVGLAPRLLSAGQAEPARGRLPPRVAVTAIECLPSRAGPWRHVPGGTDAVTTDPAPAGRASAIPHLPGALK